jgi:hypothetical protein
MLSAYGKAATHGNTVSKSFARQKNRVPSKYYSHFSLDKRTHGSLSWLSSESAGERLEQGWQNGQARKESRRTGKRCCFDETNSVIYCKQLTWRFRT